MKEKQEKQCCKKRTKKVRILGGIWSSNGRPKLCGWVQNSPPERPCSPQPVKTRPRPKNEPKVAPNGLL